MVLFVPSRRGFLTGLGALFAAPAIVRFSSLMSVQAIAPMTLAEYAKEVIEPAVSRNAMLTLQQITREAVRHWKNSNAFLLVNGEHQEAFALPPMKIGDKVQIIRSSVFALPSFKTFYEGYGDDE